jgi:exonuclease III
MLQDFYFPEAKASGLMYIHEADKEKVYKAFLSDSEAIMKQKRSVPYHGDQGVLNDLLDAQAWQTLMPGKVVSYKVHGDDGTADVVCFHGKPKPWDVE